MDVSERFLNPDTKLTYHVYHIYDIPPTSMEQKVRAEKYNLANQLLYNPILAIVKVSVILFLFRLGDKRPIVRWNLHVLFTVNLCLLISIFLADLFQCTPFRYVYDHAAMDQTAQQVAGADEKGIKDGKVVKGGHCIQQVAFFLGSAALTIATDVWLMCIPQLIVWRLHMPQQKRIAVQAILGLGIMYVLPTCIWLIVGLKITNLRFPRRVTAMSITRLVLYAKIYSPSNKDPTYDIGHTVSGVEVNLAITAASAVALPSLLKRIAPRTWGSSTASRSRTVTSGSRTGNSYTLRERLDHRKARSGSLEEIMRPDLN